MLHVPDTRFDLKDQWHWNQYTFMIKRQKRDEVEEIQWNYGKYRGFRKQCEIMHIYNKLTIDTRNATLYLRQTRVSFTKDSSVTLE